MSNLNGSNVPSELEQENVKYGTVEPRTSKLERLTDRMSAGCAVAGEIWSDRNEFGLD